jgi:molybdate transport system substrate-binding protein
MRRTTLIALLASLIVLAVPAGAQALNVYAATSLTFVFPALDKTPKYSFGGSNTLQLQIERGAPADVFASASPNEAQALFREGLCTRPVTFAINRLVLLIPNSNPGNITSVYSLRSGGRRLSIGTAGVPIGAYTRQLLRRMRLSKVLSVNRVSQQTNVGQVVSQVSLGAADAGFVYYTDGLAAKDRTKMLSLPTWAQPPVRYQICAVKRSGADTRGAAAFIKKVVSNAGRSALKHYGFGVPPRG